ncbi:SWI SNF related transcriptional regulator ATpase [Cryptosporidium sp. chipmunk genotype I]|uniref:SWI SNF related transcriptional regulator ATpase n=1 Tax=Cryptosporidium sp. chipmunk genotype I TaxID=1280935 RepID=UPI003519FB09|nr:SWI SNF related transcriptional regulator ATpase [Cryptosporidium sp. chipmunk genotype I]
MEGVRNLESKFAGYENEEGYMAMEIDEFETKPGLEKVIVEASINSTKMFGRFLETSLMFHELRKHDFEIVNRVEVPEMCVLKLRFKILIQCFRMLCRGLIPGEKLLSELFCMMDDLIIRRGFGLFKSGEKDEEKEVFDSETQMFLVLKDYFCHSKKVFRDKIEKTGSLLEERARKESPLVTGDLTRVFSELNSLRINPLGFAGSLEIESNLSNRWNKYTQQEKQFLKSFKDIDMEAKLRKYLAFPADVSYRASLTEKLIRLSKIQNKVRNMVKERAMYYQLSEKSKLHSKEQHESPDLNTVSAQIQTQEIQDFQVQDSNPNPDPNMNRTPASETCQEKSSNQKRLNALQESILEGISSSGIFVPSRITYFKARGFSMLDGISRRFSDFWASKSPTIHQYRFQIIIDGVSDERERILREKRKRKALLGRLAVSATKQVVSIQSQKQINLERKERERLRLLRENDLEAYLELVKETKNRRLQELINQTDRFLLDIGLRVQDQKMVGMESGSAQNSYSEGDQRESADIIACSEVNVDESSEFVNIPKTTSVASYYTMAHSVSESISDKPMKLLKGGSLLPYQVIGVEWMLSLYNNKLHGILADEMGLGKTVQTIALLTYLYEHKDNQGPHLVVVPLSTLPNWQKEFQIWSPELKILCFKGSRYERRSLIYEMRHTKFNVCLTTFDFIIRESGALQSMQWKHIIVDEGHRLKNSKSKFHVVLADFRSENRLLLTGTPLQNSITELWSLLNFLLPQVFHSVEDFQVWFSKPFSDLPSNEASLELSEEERLFVISRLHSILRPFLLRRVKSDVLQDLPEKKEYIVRMELTPWQKIVYDQIKQKAVHSMDLSSGKIQYRSVSNTIMQLRKIVNHPYLFVEEYLIENDDIFRVSCKFEVLDRMLPKLIRFRHKVLIFCQMTQLMDILGDFLDYRGIEHHRLDGTMTIQERKEKMDEFNSPDSEKFVFVLSTRAGGLGLNLQAADTVIIFDSDWNPHQDLQAQSRAHRMGQKNEVRVLRFVSISGVEELVLKRAQKKLEIDHKIIQAGMFNSTQVEEDEREDRLKELFGKEEYKSDSRVTTPSEINHFLARNDEELKAFEEMDKKTFGKNIYQKIQDWSKNIAKKSATSNKSVKERGEDAVENNLSSSKKNVDSDLLKYGQNISKSPSRPKKPGRRQKSIQADEQESQEEALEEIKSETSKVQEVLTLEDSKIYLECLEKSGRMIRMQEVPDWIVRPPNEVNAELGIEDNNLNEIRDLDRSERKSRWKSNKDYLCVEGLSERAFLRVMEKYEAGEITDISKELLKETNKRRRSLPVLSNQSNSESASKGNSLSSISSLRGKRSSLRNISTFKRQDRQERRKSSAYFSSASSNSPLPNLNGSFSDKSLSKKRKIISFSEDEEGEDNNEDFENCSSVAKRVLRRDRASKREKPRAQNWEDEEDDENEEDEDDVEGEEDGDGNGNGNDDDDDDDYLYSNPSSHGKKNQKNTTSLQPIKKKGESNLQNQKNTKATCSNRKSQNNSSTIKFEKESKDNSKRSNDPDSGFLLPTNYMDSLPDTPEAIVINN